MIPFEVCRFSPKSSSELLDFTSEGKLDSDYNHVWHHPCVLNSLELGKKRALTGSRFELVREAKKEKKT